MANKRTLKKSIHAICEELLAECVAASLYGNENHKDNEDAMLWSIVHMQNNFICRVSTAQVGETIDQINTL